jgi:hypothetical protein
MRNSFADTRYFLLSLLWKDTEFGGLGTWILGIVDCGLWIEMTVFVKEMVFLVEVVNLSLLSYMVEGLDLGSNLPILEYSENFCEKLGMNKFYHAVQLQELIEI